MSSISHEILLMATWRPDTKSFQTKRINGELDFYYYKNMQGYEVDFVVKQGLEITELIQVCYDVKDEKTRNREARALLHGFKDLHCSNLTVITGDYENTGTIEWHGTRRN